MSSYGRVFISRRLLVPAAAVLLVAALVPATVAAAPASTITVEVPGISLGVDTGLAVHRGQPITISASGTWCNGWYPVGSAPCAGPDGIRPAGPGETDDLVLLNQPIGLLIGRVGGWVFPIGSHAVVKMQASGELELLMNDRAPCCYIDNSGSVTASVRRGGGR
jgi:hypothetical protein